MQPILIETLHIAGTPTGACFSILIPSWNNLSYLKTCLESIHSNSAYPHQILVHANEANDGTLDWLKENNISHSWSKENAGICASLNHLARLVQTDYVLYLNDDMYVAKDWDKALLATIQSRSDHYFYYSGTMVEHKASGNKAVLAPYHFGDANTNFKAEEFLAFAATSPKKDWYGACWPPSIVHKSIWDQVGGYDEAYSPGFYSDPDFAMKLWQIGVRDFKGIGNSLVYHFMCKSTGRVERNNGRKTFAQKWGIPASFLYKVMLRMGEEIKHPEELKDVPFTRKWIAYIRAFFIARS